MLLLCSMSVYFASLNSGSNGNCYYIGNKNQAILIDAGLSCREMEKRMRRLNLEVQKIKAIFISHEHGDHIKGLATFSKKYDVPVYGSKSTFSKCKDLPSRLEFIEANSMIHINDIQITSFSKKHDAADPCSFLVQIHNKRIGVFTDLGVVCNNLIHHFQQCDAAFLEANYDENLLENGRYPIHLKNRIRGGLGHLSNTQALHLFETYRNEKLKYLLLSHLSADNNHPDLVKEMFQKSAGDTQILIAGRYQETELLQLESHAHSLPARGDQLQLF